MTEDEAKTKWCPMARVSPVGEQNLWNRNKADAGLTENKPVGVAMSRCIGSGCMAWRELPRLGNSPQSYVYRGYCGLAGVPS